VHQTEAIVRYRTMIRSQRLPEVDHWLN
jgi:hypothetical protein